MDDQLAFYFEVDTTTLPEGKTPKSFCDQAIISEHIQTDFPQIWTFWGDGGLNYPKHDFFPLYIKNGPPHPFSYSYNEVINTQYAIKFCNTAEFLEEVDAIPQRTEGDASNCAIGWPDGQTLTSINRFQVFYPNPTPIPPGYFDPKDPTALQTWFYKSCHPPKRYGAPNSFLGAPQTVRIVVCNFDKLYRPVVNITHGPNGPGHVGGTFPTGTSMTSNVENALCGLITYAPFIQVGMTITYQEGPVALLDGISVEIEAGEEIWSEEFARDWTKNLLEFDDKWRKTTKKLADKFPDLNFQFVPLTSDGIADSMYCTSAAFLPHNFQDYMIDENYQNSLVNSFSNSLAGRFLNASTPKLLATTVDSFGIPIPLPDLSPVGAIYGNVLNIVIIRASHASSFGTTGNFNNKIVSYWDTNPIRSSSEGVVDWEIDEESIKLENTDLDTDGILFGLIRDKYFENVGFNFLMDDDVLDVSDYHQYKTTFQRTGYDVWITYDFDGTDVDEHGTLQESAWYVSSIRIGQGGDTYIFTGGTKEEGSGTHTAEGEAFLQSIQDYRGPGFPDFSIGGSSSFANGLRYPGTYRIQYATPSITPGAYEDASSFGNPSGVFSGNAGNKSPSSSVIYGMVEGYSVFSSFGETQAQIDPGNGKDLSPLTERALKLIAEKADPLFQASYEGKVSIDDPIEKLSDLIRKWFHVT